MITFVCASCSRTLKVADAPASKNARCPSCGQVTAVPLPSLAATPPTRSFTGPGESSVPAVLAALHPAGEVPEAAILPPAPAAEPETVAPAPAGVHEARTMPPQAGPGADPFATMPPAAGEGRVADGRAPPGYEVLGELGRGGMGVVYKARQRALNRLCALKMILSGGHAGADDRVRFLGEAEAIARVKHPGIVQVYDFGTHDGLPFFSLELCEGGSLAGKLRDGPLPPCQAAGMVERIAQAVHAAHTAGIVHRDLKPGNVLLAEDGSPRVTDFGLAKRTEGGGQTQTGAVMGTPSYMAPEQAEGKKEVGPAADVWALGAILYECLSSRLPFRAATSLDTILQVVADEPVPLRQLNGKVPVDLETICDKCLQKDVGKRYPSAQSLAEDLRRFAEGRPIAARPVGRVERLARWCRREPVVAGLLAAVLLVLTAAVVVSSALSIKAERKAQEADEQRTQANSERINALNQEKQSRQEKDRADQQLTLAELRLYAGQLAQAQREWQDSEGGRALAILDGCQWNLRHVEYRHLWTLYNSNQLTLKGHTGTVHSVAWSPEGKRIVSGGGDFSKPGEWKVWDTDWLSGKKSA